MTDIAKLFRPEVLALSAYHVANAQGFIKLDAMENPYQWTGDVQQRWLDELKDCAINRYPDPQAGLLTQTLQSTQAIPAQSALLLGNGSDEIIQLLLMALPPASAVLSTTPSFVMYKQISDSLGLHYHGVALRADDFELDLPAMLSAIEHYQPRVIFLAYPNNPTGNLFDAEAILTIIEASQGLVVIDEAYVPFAHASFMDKLPDYDNLLVMRTVSKLGLAGLRLGYIAGQPAIIEQLNKIRLPYNINSLTQVSVDFALRNADLFAPQIQTLCEQRQLLLMKLSALDGIHVYPSSANFILFKTTNQQAGKVFETLKQHGVLIKNLSPQGGLLADCLRVTVGTPDENSAFMTALNHALAD